MRTVVERGYSTNSGEIIMHGYAMESIKLHGLLPASVSREGMAWLMSYTASPSLWRVARVTASMLGVMKLFMVELVSFGGLS